MARISSKAANSLGNKFKYNGIEHTADLDLYQYDAFYRNLDPQIGRFWQIDPKAIDEVSPYASMLNNPLTNCDALGDTTTYFDEKGNLLYQTTVNGYNNVFIINNKSLDAAKEAFATAGKDLSNIQQVALDALFLIGNRNGELGDAYDINSISAFYEKHEAQGNIKGIDHFDIDKYIKTLEVDGKPVSKSYIKSLKGAEFWASMKLVNGVWRVDDKTANTIGDMTKSNVWDNTPYVHIHNYTPQLLGKTLRYSANGLYGITYGAVGTIAKSVFP